jgi:hypothetical protein
MSFSGVEGQQFEEDGRVEFIIRTSCFSRPYGTLFFLKRKPGTEVPGYFRNVPDGTQMPGFGL